MGVEKSKKEEEEIGVEDEENDESDYEDKFDKVFNHKTKKLNEEDEDEENWRFDINKFNKKTVNLNILSTNTMKKTDDGDMSVKATVFTKDFNQNEIVDLVSYLLYEEPLTNFFYKITSLQKTIMSQKRLSPHVIEVSLFSLYKQDIFYSECIFQKALSEILPVKYVFKKYNKITFNRYKKYFENKATDQAIHKMFELINTAQKDFIKLNLTESLLFIDNGNMLIELSRSLLDSERDYIKEILAKDNNLFKRMHIYGDDIMLVLNYSVINNKVDVFNKLEKYSEEIVEPYKDYIHFLIKREFN